MLGLNLDGAELRPGPVYLDNRTERARGVSSGAASRANLSVYDLSRWKRRCETKTGGNLKEAQGQKA